MLPTKPGGRVKSACGGVCIDGICGAEGATLGKAVLAFSITAAAVLAMFARSTGGGSFARIFFSA
jgi:hypothetical protein